MIGHVSSETISEYLFALTMILLFITTTVEKSESKYLQNETCSSITSIHTSNVATVGHTIGKQEFQRLSSGPNNLDGSTDVWKDRNAGDNQKQVGPRVHPNILCWNDNDRKIKEITDRLKEVLSENRDTVSDEKERMEKFIIGTGGSVEKLIAGFKLEDGAYIESIVDALTKKGQSAIAPLLKALENSDADIRSGAVSALGKLKSTKALDSLIRMLERDPDEGVRASCASALANLDEPKIFPKLLSALEDDSEAVRIQAAGALENFKDQIRRETLGPFFRDENPQVREAIAKALGFEDVQQATREMNPWWPDNQLPPCVNYKIPNFTVIYEEVAEAPAKAQVLQHILVSGDITKEGLTDLLKKLFKEAQLQTGFKYHKSPTVIGIYLYSLRDRAFSEMGQWIGMLFSSRANENPDIRINDKQIWLSRMPQEHRLGLSEDDRMKIFREIILAERKSEDERDRKFPLSMVANRPQEMSEASDYFDKVVAIEKKKVANQFDLKLWQINQIAYEGSRKQWPFPPPQHSKDE